MAHQHYRTKGIVLAKRDSGEADQIFVLYTQDFGKIEVVGRAVRKITSKLRAGIDVFYFIEIEFIQGKNRKTLTDAIIIDKFLNLRKNSEALICANQIFEVVGRLTIIEKKDNEVFRLLMKIIKIIDNLIFENSLKIENWKLKIILNYFLWNFFSLLGYSPELYSCPVCNKKLLPETFFLSPHHGGVVCWGCCKKIKEENQQFLFSEVNVNTVKLIRFLINQPIERAQKLNSCQNDLQNLMRASGAYFSFLVENSR